MPGDPDGAGDGRADGGGVFGCRQRRAACADGGRGGAYRGERRRAKAIWSASGSSPRPRRPRRRRSTRATASFSENADFAQAVIDAGLVWVGPKPASIRAMGLKDAAKRLMAEAGVPVTPGYLGEDQSPTTLKKEAGKIGYPVLIKAVAGGGGKGMRRVDAGGGFRRRAGQLQARGGGEFRRRPRDPREIYPQPAPHRGAGVRRQPRQRRPFVRARLLVAAAAPESDRGSAGARDGRGDARSRVRGGGAGGAGGAIRGRGDGRVHRRRFSDGLKPDRIWFMEMNTRLQVEHPVTEEITGVDLVEWQLRVASGEKLPKTQDEADDHRPRDRGAAVRRRPGQGVSAERRAARAFRSWAARAASKPGSRRATRSRLITTR